MFQRQFTERRFYMHELTAENRATFAAAIDRFVNKALSAMKSGEHNNAQVEVYIHALQELRLEILGEFKRIVSPGLKYSKSNRIDPAPPGLERALNSVFRNEESS